MRPLALGLALALALTAPAFAQQVPDPDVDVGVASPAFPAGKGPVVVIDAHHRNFHTVDGRYLAFAALLSNDGFQVKGLDAEFAAASLSGVNILVVANAGPPAGADPAADPQQSAFTPAEIAAVKAWVEGGGSLFLIADHMPFAGAASDLGKAFGVTFANGYVSIPREGPPPDLFTREAGTLVDDPILKAGGEPITVVGTFTGSSFTIPDGGRPILILPKGARLITPDASGAITTDGPSRDVAGQLQGALLKVGKGRVVVFGEGAMFSAQLAGPQKMQMGFNSPSAPRNRQLLLNLAHWLAGLPPD